MVVDELREASAEVARRARHVEIDLDAIPAYARSLCSGTGPVFPVPSTIAPGAPRDAAAFWLTLDAINFGSGWFPTLRKGSHGTGYRTIEAGVRRRFEESGAWSAGALAELTPMQLAGLMDQDPEHELMTLFAESLRDLGSNLAASSGGSFTALVDGARGSAVNLVETLAAWRCFADVSVYDEISVPFFKRAQIAAADLHRAGIGGFTDIASLTMFADNLVPHVLRLDGVLHFEDDLMRRIEAVELIEHGSKEEVEIRACAVHAVELTVAAASTSVTAADLDALLWNRGQQAAYKATPRHRSRTTAY